MDLRRVRRGRHAAFLRGALPSLALALSATLYPSLAQDPHPRWNEIFTERLPELERAAQGEGELDRDAALDLYLYLLYFRATHSSQWPEGVSFRGSMARIHELRRAERWPAEPFATADYNLSLNFEMRGTLAEGREHLEWVVEQYDPSTPHLPHVFLQLSFYARGCREFSAARRFHERALAGIALSSDRRIAAHVRPLLHRHLASYYIAVGLYDLAPAELERAWQLIDELEYTYTPVNERELAWMMGEVLLEEFNLLLSLDRQELLISRYEEALSSSWYAGIPPYTDGQIRLRVAFARVELGIRNEDYQIDPELQPALTNPELPSDERQLIELLLADIDLARDDFDSAEERLNRVLALLASETNACAYQAPSRREVHARVLAAQLALERAAGAEELRRHLDDARAAFDSMMSRWSSVPTHDGGLSLLQTRDRLLAGEALVELILAVEGPELGPARAVEEIAEFQVLGTLARDLGAGVPTLEEVTEHLVPPRGGLLLYLPGSSDSRAFCLDRDAVTAHVVEGILEIDPVREAFHRELVNALRSEELGSRFEPMAAELGAVLLPPDVVQRISAWEELVVVGVDSIGYVPFELLRCEGQRLGDHKAISYLPSLPVGVFLAKRGVLPDASVLAHRPMLVLAAPDAARTAPELAQGLQPLPFEAPEEELLLKRCELMELETLRGEAASLGALLARDLSGALGLHIIAHGIDTGRSDRPTGLLLFGSEGILRPELAESLRCPPLVMLTACGGWRGPIRRGDDGRQHLGGAFFLAGARTVLLSHLDVDYQSNLELLGEFYDGFTHDGLSPARAMLRARQVHGQSSLEPYLVHASGLAHESWLEKQERPRRPRALGWLVVVAVVAAGAVTLARRGKT